MPTQKNSESWDLQVGFNSAFKRLMNWKQRVLFVLKYLHSSSRIKKITGFGGLGVACWPLVPKFAGLNPAESVGVVGRKNPQHAFLRRGIKPSVPCRRFAACKRSLNLRGSRNWGKITARHLSRPQFHISLLGSHASLRTEALGV